MVKMIVITLMIVGILPVIYYGIEHLVRCLKLRQWPWEV
jgi:hypothetical protein